IAHTIGFLTSLHALMATRTAQGSVAWIVSLNAMPYAAVPAYWVFGRSRFHGYESLRTEQSPDPGRPIAQLKDLHPYRENWQDHPEGKLGTLEKLGRMAVTDNNSVELLTD